MPDAVRPKPGKRRAAFPDLWVWAGLAATALLVLVVHAAPALGLTTVSAWLPSVQLAAARSAFSDGSDRTSPAVMVASKLAAAGSPLEAQPFYFAAVERQMQGRDSDVLPLLDSTLLRNPRHYFARLWRARIYYAADRIPEAIREVLLVLPLNRRDENEYMAALVDVARDPRNRPLLLELMAGDPYWGPAFVQRVNAELPDDDFRLALASLSEASFSQHVRSLVDGGEYERAFLVWQEAQTPEQLLLFQWPADPTFSSEEVDHPLGWRIDRGIASREREGLYVFYSGRGQRRALSQTMLLGRGFSYRLSISMSGEMKERGGWFRWDLACPDSNTVLARLDVRAVDATPEVSDIEFTLPDETCPAQRLTLTAEPGEYPFPARLSVREVRIKQLVRTPAPDDVGDAPASPQ